MVAFSVNACSSILYLFLPDKEIPDPIRLQIKSEKNNATDTILITSESSRRSIGRKSFYDLSDGIVALALIQQSPFNQRLKLDDRTTQNKTEYYIFKKEDFSLIAKIIRYEHGNEHGINRKIPSIYDLRPLFFSENTLFVSNNYENASFEVTHYNKSIPIERYRYDDPVKSKPEAAILAKEITGFLHKGEDRHLLVSFNDYRSSRISTISNLELPLSVYVDDVNEGGYSAHVRNDKYAPNLIPTTGYIATISKSDKNGFVVTKEKYDAKSKLNLDQHFDTSDLTRKIYAFGHYYSFDVSKNFFFYSGNAPAIMNQSYFAEIKKEYRYYSQDYLMIANNKWVSLVSDSQNSIRIYYTEKNKNSALYIIVKPDNSYDIGEINF